MINIRTITYNMPSLIENSHFDTVKNCIKDWHKSNYYIRTCRINNTPLKNTDDIAKCDRIDKFCEENAIKWFTIPFDFDATNEEEFMNCCYTMIKKYDKCFINLEGVKDSLINFDVIKIYAKLVKKIGRLSHNGKDNFRFGLSVNSISDSPFFPFTKSSGEFSFSIGLELTQDINKIIDCNKNLDYEALRTIIVEQIDKQISEIEKYALEIEKKYNIRFKGFDFSLAPIIEEHGSVLEILEKLGIDNFDGPGTMFVTAYLTNILKSFGNNHKIIGFSGVMYSLLEDEELSNLNNMNKIKLEDIVKLSTMCGCGIDMVPIKETTKDEIIISYILDIAAISCRLNKPLGVRFLPIKQHGISNYTKFVDDDDFITNTKILKLHKNVLSYNQLKSFKFIDLVKKVTINL